MSVTFEAEAGTLRAQALEATRQRDWPAAARLWQVLADAAPDFEALFRLAESKFFLRRHAEAAAVARAALELRPGDPRPRTVLARSLSAFGPAAAVDAAAAWNAVLDLAGESFEAWARLAESQMHSGETEAMLSSLLRMLMLEPRHPFGLDLAARLLGAVAPAERSAWLDRALPGSTAEAGTALLQVAARLDPGDLGLQGQLAARLVSRNAHEAALEPLAALARARPDAPEHLRAYARALHRAERWGEAAGAWRRLLRRRDGDREATFRLAQALRLSGAGGQALEFHRRALQRDAADLAVLRDYSRCLEDLGREDEAKVAWQRALESRPGDAALRLEHASHLIRTRRYADAEPLLEEMTGGAPGFDRASLLLLRLLQGRGDADGLLRRFAPAFADGPPAELDSTAREVALRYGLALLAKGRLAEAAAAIEPAHAAGPPAPLAVRAMLRLLLARGDHAAAEALARGTLAAQREQSWAWREVIGEYGGSEQPELAVEAFETAATLFRDRPRDWLDIAEAAERDHLGRSIRERLGTLDFAEPADRLRAGRLALREGALDLAGRLLAGDVPGGELGEQWQRQRALVARARDLAGGRAGDRLVFPDAVFEMLCARAARRAPRADWGDGPIVLANSSLAAGGAERQISMTLRGLAARFGPEAVHLVCTRMTEAPARRFYLKAVQEADVPVTDLAGEPAGAADLSALDPADRDLVALLGDELSESVAKLYGAFVRLKPRVVHLWQDRTSIDGAVAALLAGVPRVVLCARSTRPATRQRLRGYMRAAYAALLRLPQVRLGNNSFAGARDYEDWLDLPGGAVGVVHNGFEFDKLARAADPALAAAIRAELGIPPEAPVVGGVLRLSDVKRPLLWVEAAAAVGRARPDAHFVLAGDGPLRGEVLALAERLGIADRLHLPGHVEVPPWFRMMDLVLLTSRTEGLPNVLVEAQSLGRPVVSTRVGGVVEALEEGVTGHSVPADAPDLPGALADRVLAVLDDPAWLSRARGETVRFALSRFSAEAMVQRSLELYGMAVPAAAPADAAPPAAAERAASARRHAAGGDWAAAAAAWDAVLADSPGDTEALLGAGRARFALHDLAGAKALFGRALGIAPAIEPLRWLARTLRGLGEEREALTLWGELLAAAPQDVEALLRSAEGKAHLGDLPGAIAAARDALDQTGGRYSLRQLLARLLLQAGELREALRQWEAIAAGHSEDAEALFRAGQTALRLGEGELAEARLRAALDLPRPDPRAAAALAKHLAWTGRLGEARAVLRRAARRGGLRNPELAQGLFGWLRVAGRGRVTDRYFRALRRRAGGNAAARLRLAELLAAAERPTSARAVLAELAREAEPGPAAAAAGERAIRSALRAADVDAVAAVLRGGRVPPAVRQEALAAARFADALRQGLDTTGGAASAFFARLGQAADRRGHPRYLPRRGAVLHVINSLAMGGSERQCVNLARAQAAAGREVTVLRTDPARAGRATFFLDALAGTAVATGTLEDHASGARGALAGLPELAVPQGTFGEALVARQVAGIAAAIRALRPEAVVAWSPQCMADAAVAGLALGVPRLALRSGSVALPRRGDTTETESERYALWREAMRALLGRGSGLLLNNCAANLADWLDWLGLDAAALGGRADVLPNIIDLDRLRPARAGAVAALRRELGIPDGAPVIGSVARLEGEKGLDLWLEAVRAVHADRPEAVFVLVGDGRLADPLRREIAGAGLAGAVRLVGAVGEDLPAHYGLFDALLLTSSVEGFPNAVAEAQCFGLPVVAPRLGGVPDAVEPDAGHHRLLATRDPAAWRDALLLALQAPEQSRAARQAAGRRFIAGRCGAAAVLARCDRLLFDRAG